MRLADLKLNPDNPRNIKPEKLEKLAQSIKDFPKMMVKRPIVYDEDKIIIGGNMRYKAIEKLGMTEIPDEWTSDASDFTPDERKRFIMQDNAEMGVTDWDMVANQYELEDLEAWGIDVPYADTETEIEEDEPPEVSSEPPKSKLGEIYQLGRHRVMCGDSTDKANVDLLMNGEKADMVFTDPPYGMLLDTDYSTMHKSSDFGKGGKTYDKVIGDNDDFTPELITSILDNFSYCKEIFLWGADYYRWLIPNGGSWVVWDKRGGETGMNLDKLLGSSFELCWSLKSHKRDIARILWSGHHGMQKSDQKSRTHPTEKPTELARWFFDRWGKDAKNVIDVYLGSGSTLIACEQTDRTCYGMELDPKYTDVIRKRYWKFVNNNEETGWEENTPAISGKEQGNDE